MTFTASGSGSATLQALGMPAWSGNNRTNVMMNLTVINAAGAIVSARTGPGIGAHSVPVAAGATYYITLNGIGQGVATSNTGYSNYGARGQYEMVLTYPVAAVPPPPPPATPSPSPSPQPPSPSPSPKPANWMKITSFVGSRTSGYQVTCTFTITVVDSSNGARINTPSLSGQWTSKRSVFGWPYSAKYTGSSAGVITATATKKLSSATGNGCTFTVTSGSLTAPGYTGYTMDPSSIKSGVMYW